MHDGVASDTAVSIGRTVGAATRLRSVSRSKAVEPVFRKTLLWFPALHFNYRVYTCDYSYFAFRQIAVR